MDCPYYENDEVMAAFGRAVIDQYIGFRQKGEKFEGFTGPVSYIIAHIEQYVDEGEEG